MPLISLSELYSFASAVLDKDVLFITGFFSTYNKELVKLALSEISAEFLLDSEKNYKVFQKEVENELFDSESILKSIDSLENVDSVSLVKFAYERGFQQYQKNAELLLVKQNFNFLFPD